MDFNKWKKKIKRTSRKVIDVVSIVWKKYGVIPLLAVCGGLLLAVVILSARLHGVKGELKSVQAMAASLQEELKTTQDKTVTSAPKNNRAEVSAPPVKTPTSVPTETPSPEPKGYVICVDAGHGGWDGGAVIRADGNVERAEKDDNLWMAKLFRDALEAYGIEVVMTREDDTFLELTERTDIANEAGADAIISLHRNSYNGEEEVNGVEIWIHSSMPEASSELAGGLLEALMETGGMQNRGVKAGSMTSSKEDYAINRNAKMTSMIVEFGFITSPADNTAYDEYGETYAGKMAEVVYEWLIAQK